MNDDRRLDSEAQRQVAEWVHGLPEEEAPSLAWRAALNEGVRQEAERRARKRWRWNLVRPVLGFAATAALAAVVFVPRSFKEQAPVGSRLEAGLISLHEDSVQVAEIVGTGVRPAEVPPSAMLGPDSMIDLEAGAL